MKNMFKQFSILPIFEDEKVYGSKINLNSIKWKEHLLMCLLWYIYLLWDVFCIIPVNITYLVYRRKKTNASALRGNVMED